VYENSRFARSCWNWYRYVGRENRRILFPSVGAMIVGTTVSWEPVKDVVALFAMLLLAVLLAMKDTDDGIGMVRSQPQNGSESVTNTVHAVETNY